MSVVLQIIHFEQFQHTASALSQALVAGLWQGIVLAIATGIVLRFLPRTTATARFFVWITVFIASAALPLLHLVASAQPVAATSLNHLSFDSRWSYLLAALWMSAALFRLLMLAIEAVALRRIWRTATPIAEDVWQRAGLQAFVAERRVEVCTTQEVDRPSVIGFFAPRILIPVWLLAEISDTELRHIVLHEMEHLRRRDDWLNLIQQIGLVFFPLNPAMFWIDRRLSTEREIACDDGVLLRTQAARAYATSLTSIAERRLHLNSRRNIVALALGAFGVRRSEFAVRIESILKQRPSQRVAGRPAVAAVLVVGIVGGTAGMVRTPNFVTFRSDTSPAMAAASTSPDRVFSPPRAVSAETLQNASYRVQEKPALGDKRSMAAISTRVKAIPVIALEATTNRQVILERAVTPRTRSNRSEGQWVVLTSWQESASPEPDHSTDDPDTGTDALIPVSRVVVRTPDGRFFATPYAALPTQAGWLIVQM